MPQRVLLLGGTSEIGLALVRRLSAERPLRAMLAGRDEVALQEALGTLGDVSGEIATIDAEELEDHRQALMEAFERFGGFDTVVLAIGLLGGQAGLATPREESL